MGDRTKRGEDRRLTFDDLSKGEQRELLARYPDDAGLESVRRSRFVKREEIDAARRRFERDTGLPLGDPALLWSNDYQLCHAPRHRPPCYYEGPHPPACDPQIAAALRRYDLTAHDRQLDEAGWAEFLQRHEWTAKDAKREAHSIVTTYRRTANRGACRRTLTSAADLLAALLSSPECCDRLQAVGGKRAVYDLSVCRERLAKAAKPDGWPQARGRGQHQAEHAFGACVRALARIIAPKTRKPLTAAGIRDVLVWAALFNDPDDTLAERARMVLRRAKSRT